MKLPFDPSKYDIFHLGISGGKDSAGAYLWLLNESDLPLDRVILSFCDTGNEDYYTYEFLSYLNEGHEITTVHPEMDFWELAKFKRRFPSRRARFCTQNLKIIPTRDFIFQFLQGGKRVLLLTGVRKEEGKTHNNRGNLPQFGWDEGLACDVFRPLYFWSVGDVWDIHKRYLDLNRILSMVRADPFLDEASERWQKLYNVRVDFKSELILKIAKHGIPRNPLYDMGASRVGCFPCINSAKPELRAMNKYRPQRIDFLGQKEIETGKRSNVGYSSFFARKTVPEQHRSKPIITTKGEQMNVVTIYDVMEWALTSRGGKQFDFDPDIILGDELPACGIHGECE